MPANPVNFIPPTVAVVDLLANSAESLLYTLKSILPFDDLTPYDEPYGQGRPAKVDYADSQTLSCSQASCGPQTSSSGGSQAERLSHPPAFLTDPAGKSSKFNLTPPNLPKFIAIAALDIQ
jgi:hypothetical protein